MDTTNYFRFYEIQPSFEIDEKSLKEKYLKINKEFHPDFFALDKDKQGEALNISSYNNDAYKVLKKFDSRVAYYLSMFGLYDKEQKADLPPDFLMDVIDLNEEVADAKFEEDSAQIEAVKNKVNSLMQECIDILKGIGAKLNETEDKDELHNQAKTEFQKYKYFYRLYSKI